MKACLQDASIAPTKTYDLSALLDLLPNALTSYTIEFRYPGMVATQAIAAQALQACITVRQIVR